MKSLLFSISLLLIITANSFTQTFAVLNQTKTKADLLVNTDAKIRFVNSITGLYLNTHKTKDGIYTKLNIPGYFPNKDIGNPELPVMTKLIEIPYNAKIEVNIISYDKETINLNDHGYTEKVFPNQVSLFKNQDPASVPFEKKSEIYQEYACYNTEPVVVNYKGRMRGINIAQIVISPFEYDIASNTLTIRNNLEVEILFNNADLLLTETKKADKYSPSFKSAYKKLWNYKTPKTKEDITKYPVKYVIVSDRMFEEELQAFIEWKTKKGFYIIEAYTDEIGNTTDEIKEYLQNLYDAGTTDDPAPTYVLFVGDVEQVPSFQMPSHVSDMYYCEFDGNGDYIPDMYFGRFSANNVEQLRPQIEKTLMYEQFTFPETDFIVKSVLVAGTDGTYGYSHANGQINYATNYYFNEDKGVVDHTYLYPESGSQASNIINDISNGVGFVNYTAHCSSNGWAGPNFTVSNIPNLQNEDMYFFIISNCCQSNKFNVNECFGEAILRADKKGAVVHIGGSNDTMWDEDFYWSVGITSNIKEHTTYEETTTAVYDHLFHDNNEEPYTSAYQIIFKGNMEVMASTSSRDKYYWEIYHVLGDPSVMPYIGEITQIDAEYLPQFLVGINNITVTTEPDAYVAISIEGKLLDAKIADTNGKAFLDFDVITSEAIADIVVTKQFRAPHIGSVTIVPNDSDYDVMLKAIIEPQSIIHISEASFNPTVEIINLGQINLETAVVGYYIDNEADAVEINWEGNLEMFESETIIFPEITLDDGIYNFTAYVDNPNEQEDEYPGNNQRSKLVNVYSGNVRIDEIINPQSIICNQSEFIPRIIVKNLDNYPLTNLKCSYECDEINHEFIWEGNIEGGQTDTVSFPENYFPEGTNTISYNISEPNGGTNLNTNNISANAEFSVILQAQLFELDLYTDTWGSENTWELIDYSTKNILYSGGPYPDYIQEHYIYNWCLLKEGCYTFTIYDSYGDGMGSSSSGQILITNIDTGEIIFDLEGDNEEFKDSAFVTFCVDDIICPDDIFVEINKETFLLEGGIPMGGQYSGEGVVDGYFNPELADSGEHIITYSYTFEGSEEELSCSFSIFVTNLSDVKKTDYQDVNIFPNPSTGIIYINNVNNINVEIINMTGQIVKRINNLNKNAQIDISDYPNGIYLIKIIDGKKNINKKINLQK